MKKKKSFSTNKLYNNLLEVEKKIAFKPYSNRDSNKIQNILDTLNLKVIRIKKKGIDKLNKHKLKLFNNSLKNVKKSFKRWNKSKKRKH